MKQLKHTFNNHAAMLSSLLDCMFGLYRHNSEPLVRCIQHNRNHSLRDFREMRGPYRRLGIHQ